MNVTPDSVLVRLRHRWADRNAEARVARCICGRAFNPKHGSIACSVTCGERALARRRSSP